MLEMASTVTKGEPKMIPHSTPIPNSGRFYFKFRLINVDSTFPLQFGIKTSSNIKSETFVKGVQPNVIMYSRVSQQQQSIFEGDNQFEAFPFNKNEVLTMLIDQ